MTNFWESTDEINKDVLGLTMLASGLFICFFGAKFFKHIIFFVGFIAGGLGAYFLVPEMLSIVSVTISDDMLLYVSLAVGAVVGVLFVIIYKAAVFSCGAICGVIVAQLIWQTIIIPYFIDDIPYSQIVQICTWIVFAIVGGWLAFKFVEFVLKGITAFIGAFMFSSSVAYFIERLEQSKNNSTDPISYIQFFTTKNTYSGSIIDSCDVYCIVCVCLWLLLFFMGCFIQYKFHKRHKRKDYDDEISESSDYEYEDDRKRERERRKQAKRESRKGNGYPVTDVSSDNHYNSHNYNGPTNDNHNQSFDGAPAAHRPSYYREDPNYSTNAPAPHYDGYGSQYNQGYRGRVGSGDSYV